MERLEQIDQYRWRLPKSGKMRTQGIVLSDKALLGTIGSGVVDQLTGVASLPGIVGPALAMPDAHQGYGFPIGGVAAFDPDHGVVSPGGVGYDINCGIRLLRTKLEQADIDKELLQRVADVLADFVPCGVGVGGSLQLSEKQLENVLVNGSAWAVGQGMGLETDLEFCEASGSIAGADPDYISKKARKRGSKQLGTLGAGNHFVEVGIVSDVFDSEAALAFGLNRGQIVVWIHSGSRGLGHQVCDDYLRELGSSDQAVHSDDRQLVSALATSQLGKQYINSMACAANFAFANRQVLTHLVRSALEHALRASAHDLGLGLIYDVAHNIAKLEQHQVSKQIRPLWVHRKGATRALGPGHDELPGRYRTIGQPVLLPGDMGRASFVLKGTKLAQEQTFASSAHGAGRNLSRTKAKKMARGRRVDMELAEKGILVRAHSRSTLAEEMPEAYKDASQVVKVMDGSGVATLVAKTVPIAVVKG